MDITGVFGGVSSTMTIVIEDSQASLTSLFIVNNVGASSTLTGSVGTSDTLSVTTYFDDGTNIVVANSGSTASWLPPASFLTFTSSVPTSIGVSAAGEVDLRANYYKTIGLTVTDACGTGVSYTRNVYANLNPAVHDVDLGATSGATFGTIGGGPTFSVPVRIQGRNGADVTAFQIEIVFDDTKLFVASDAACSQGSGWSSSFSCTTNDPPNKVLLIGSCGLSPSSGCQSRGLNTVATVNFTVVDGASTLTTNIGGFIVKIKDDISATTDVSIFAGDDTLEITVSGFVSATSVSQKAAAQRHVFGVREAVAYDELLGDTNGECAFDVEDVQYLQYYIGGSVNPSDSRQLAAMDPDLDGDADGVDIYYLMRVLAGKYRFIADFTPVSYPFTLTTRVLTAASTPASSASTEVSYEIGTLLNKGPNLLLMVGLSLTDTEDGVYLPVLLVLTRYYLPITCTHQWSRTGRCGE